MGVGTPGGTRTRAFAWLMTLMVLAFMTSACGQTSTPREENADEAPPANAPAEDQDDQADDGQGDDQADDQNEGAGNQDDQSDDGADGQNGGSDDQDDN